MAKKKTVTRSNEERILRVWDIETIKDLMSRRTIYERTGAARPGAGGALGSASRKSGNCILWQELGLLCGHG